MRLLIIGLALSVVLGLGTSLLLAQDNSGSSSAASGNAPSEYNMSSKTTSGSVVSSDGRNLTITTDSGQEMKFAIDENSSGMPSDVQAGARVDVTYMVGSDGSYRATKVALSPTGAGSGGATGGSGSTYDDNAGGTGGSNTREAGATGATGQTGAMNPESRHLPGTASSRPLIGVIGLIALGGALAFRLTSQRS